MSSLTLKATGKSLAQRRRLQADQEGLGLLRRRPQEVLVGRESDNLVSTGTLSVTRLDRSLWVRQGAGRRFRVLVVLYTSLSSGFGGASKGICSICFLQGTPLEEPSVVCVLQSCCGFVNRADYKPWLPLDIMKPLLQFCGNLFCLVYEFLAKGIHRRTPINLFFRKIYSVHVSMVTKRCFILRWRGQ
jgi:hypothetical protein